MKDNRKLVVTRKLKRKFIKINDIAQNTDSGVLGIVKGIVEVDEKGYALWELIKTGQVVLITASKLRAVYVRIEHDESVE